MNIPDPLPSFVEQIDVGDWSAHEDALYTIYNTEVVGAGLTFRGLPISFRRRPQRPNGKAGGFWHLITEGSVEDDKRTPDSERCRRIRWIAWVIRNAETSTKIRWWKNRRFGNTHVVLWLWEEKFAVVLAQRNGFYLLKTAYLLKRHRENTFKREWREYQNNPW